MSEVGAVVEAEEANPLKPIGTTASERLAPGAAACPRYD